MISADQILEALMSYRPSPGVDAAAVWPPRSACSGWHGSSPSALPYARRDMEELLQVMARESIHGGTVVLTRHFDGLPNLFWGELFDRVVSFQQEHATRFPVRDGRYEIHFGQIDDGRFMYPLVPTLTDVRAIVFDDIHYNRLIAPYFLFRKAMQQKGIMVFTRAQDAGVRRFLADLRSALLDNRTHDIIDCTRDPEGLGTAYELVDPVPRGNEMHPPPSSKIASRYEPASRHDAVLDNAALKDLLAKKW